MSASFRSSSRRLNPSSSSSKTSTEGKSRAGSPKKAPPRRSRSVSAFSRSQCDVFSDEFANKRDNPLFCDGIGAQIEVKALKLEDSRSSNAVATANVGGETRGRSISRKGEIGGNGAGPRRESGRRMSVVDTARRSRSVSRRPVSRGNSEIGLEQDANLSRNLRNRNASISSSGVKKGALTRSNSSLSDKMEGLRPRGRSNSNHFGPSGELNRRDMLSTKAANWEDLVSTSSMSEAEEMSFRATSKQMESVQGDNLVGGASGIYETVRSEVRRAIYDIQNDLENANMTGIPPDFMSPGGIELSDVEREYAKKLEQSEERARKLRAELAVEEQRRIELSKILKEELQDPKSHSLQKSRVGRKASMERRKISKTLTEDAMAYFDECVSLSTFDSTDFSSFEEPPLTMVGGTTLENDNDQEACTSAIEPNRFQFSFSSLKQPKTSELRQDIRSYVKSFEKNTQTANTKSLITTGSKEYSLDAYTPPKSPESLLLDQVYFKNRLESGSMLLCSSGSNRNFIFNFC